MRLLVTRPEEEAASLAAALRRLGAEPLIQSLLRVEYKSGPPLDLAGVQAILATSANGVRAFARRERRRELPVYAVGDASAQAATEAGFAEVRSAAGDVEALARLVSASLDPAEGAVLHVAGTAVAGDLAGHLREAGFAYRRAVLYAARAVSRLSAATARAIAAGAVDGALFFSPRTAAIFVRLVRRRHLNGACRGMTAFCLSPAVAEQAAAIAWRQVRVAERPAQDALLATIAAELRRRAD